MPTRSRPSPIPWKAGASLIAWPLVAWAIACSSGAKPSSDATRDAGRQEPAESDAQGDADLDGGPQDTGPHCYPASVASFQAPAYVPARGYQAVCSMDDIALFFGACASLGSTDCAAWMKENVTSDAGAGTACGNCIASPDNGGALWFDPLGYAWPNLGGCMQVVDPVHGPACAKAYEAANGCRTVACDHVCLEPNPDCSETCDDCYNAVDSDDGGGCASYESAENGACGADFADGGALDTCAPGDETENLTAAVTILCGPRSPGN